MDKSARPSQDHTSSMVLWCHWTQGLHLRCRLLLWLDVLLAYSSHRYKRLLQQYVTFLWYHDSLLILLSTFTKKIHAHNMLFLRLTKSRALFYLTPTWYDVVGRLVSLPFLIPEPFKEKRHGSCRWFLLDQTTAKDWWSFARTGRVVSRNTITVTARSLSRIPASLGLQEFLTGGW